MPSSTMAATSYSYVENQLAILRSDSLLRRVVIKERCATECEGIAGRRCKTKTIRRRRKSSPS